MTEREHAEAVARAFCDANPVAVCCLKSEGRPLVAAAVSGLIERERAAAREDERRRVLEEVYEEARKAPWDSTSTGREFQAAQSAASSLRTYVLNAIRALATKKGTTP